MVLQVDASQPVAHSGTVSPLAGYIPYRWRASPGEIGRSLDEHVLRRLMAVGRTLVSQLDLQVVLQELLEVARELTGARYAALGILDAERRGLEGFHALGIDDETRKAIGDLPRGRGVLGLLVGEEQPLRLEDVGSHPRSFGFPPATRRCTASSGCRS